MGLAKQILENKSNNSYGCDEFGIPLKDGQGKDVTLRPQYLVARALLTEQQNPEYDQMTTHRLHMRNGLLYNYNKEVKEDNTTFFKLTGVEYHVPLHIRAKFWEELKRRVPTLNTDFYKVCDGLWWNKKSGEILIGSDNEVKKKAIGDANR